MRSCDEPVAMALPQTLNNRWMPTSICEPRKTRCNDCGSPFSNLYNKRYQCSRCPQETCMNCCDECSFCTRVVCRDCCAKSHMFVDPHFRGNFCNHCCARFTRKEVVREGFHKDLVPHLPLTAEDRPEAVDIDAVTHRPQLPILKRPALAGLVFMRLDLREGDLTLEDLGLESGSSAREIARTGINEQRGFPRWPTSKVHKVPKDPDHPLRRRAMLFARLNQFTRFLVSAVEKDSFRRRRTSAASNVTEKVITGKGVLAASKIAFWDQKELEARNRRELGDYAGKRLSCNKAGTRADGANVITTRASSSSESGQEEEAIVKNGGHSALATGVAILDQDGGGIEKGEEASPGHSDRAVGDQTQDDSAEEVRVGKEWSPGFMCGAAIAVGAAAVVGMLAGKAWRR